MIPTIIVKESTVYIAGEALTASETTALAMSLCEAADQARAYTEWKRGDYEEPFTRLCRTCGLERRVDTEWYFNKSRGSYNPRCRPCTSARRKELGQ